MSVQLSSSQHAIVDQILRWYRDPHSDLVFYLAGYAGTGKTTLARFVADEIGNDVLFAAYTGKAAQAMMKRGVEFASTIHSLIYVPFEVNIDERMAQLSAELATATNPLQVKKLKEEIEDLQANEHKPRFALNHDSALGRANLLILDECSMVDRKVGEDLMFFNTKILVLGDPAQLPPVKGSGYFTERSPNAFLREIHRQAEGDPILDIATRARNGEHIPFGTYGDRVRVISRDAVSTSAILQEYDQILCGFNKTRHTFNQRSRRVLAYANPIPMTGEKLISLKNDRDTKILNGTLMRVTEDAECVEDDPEAVHLQVCPDDHAPIYLNCIKSRFTAPDDDPGFLKKRLMDLDYGYAITVHKSQGSEWESVCLLDDGFGRGADRARWVYTAVTRARSKLLIVR